MLQYLNNPVTETILPSDCQHKADGYLTKMLFPRQDADSARTLI
ncbi:hypothetical protein BN4901_0284 [Citrobacter europaeus]|uniref:Uncharacterized protein n=1 Tax=Citrobacter europaeus TaxID=1914243 RepID=A0ABY0JW41_9ENTR|nr:hypothetical protein CIP106467_4963 [Citrobacter europaeus]SCA74419.1 hypothetical protein BN4901_0284 [Citrobacter europaeus]